MSLKTYYFVLKDRPTPISIEADEMEEPSTTGSLRTRDLQVQSFYILKKGGEVIGKFKKDSVESWWTE